MSDVEMTEAPAAVSTLPVVEIFHAPQGEGTRIGEPATFIRLAGCNLRCSWCDTPYSWSPEGVQAAEAMSVEQLAGMVRERAVVITGGEPMLHARRLEGLVAALRDARVGHVTVETNATIVAGDDLYAAVDLWSLSPKLPASGESFPTDEVMQWLAHDVAAMHVQLKLVIAEIDRDLPAMWQSLSDVGVFSSPMPPSVIVQPDGMRADYDVALRELAEAVMSDDGLLPDGRPRRSMVRVLPQAHRVAWGAGARGV